MRTCDLCGKEDENGFYFEMSVGRVTLCKQDWIGFIERAPEDLLDIIFKLMDKAAESK